jgi:hypothetical protein
MVTEEDAEELPRLTAIKDQWRAYAADYSVADELDAIIEGLIRRGTRGSDDPALPS